MIDNERSPNDQRSDAKNPNNPEHDKDIANRENLGHLPPSEDKGESKATG